MKSIFTGISFPIAGQVLLQDHSRNILPDLFLASCAIWVRRQDASTKLARNQLRINSAPYYYLGRPARHEQSGHQGQIFSRRACQVRDSIWNKIGFEVCLSSR